VTHEESQGAYKDSYKAIVNEQFCAASNDWKEVGMGFGLTADLGKRKVLVGGGALTCTIILVHMRRGVGALGHFNADDDPRKVVGGVEQMVRQLNASTGFTGQAPIAVALSGGLIDTPNYITRCLNGVRALYTGCSATYVAPASGIYGSCVYIPLQYRAAFNDGGNRSGNGDGLNIVCKNYDRQLASVIC